jgi:hypothetical protein
MTRGRIENNRTRLFDFVKPVSRIVVVHLAAAPLTVEVILGEGFGFAGAQVSVSAAGGNNLPLLPCFGLQGRVNANFTA